MPDQAETHMSHSKKMIINLCWIVPSVLLVLGILGAWVFVLTEAALWLGQAGWHAVNWLSS